MSKNLGDAFVRVRPNTDGFESEARSGLSGGLKKVAGLVAGVFASGVVAKGANALVGRASDLNETVNKSTVIFGAQAKMIERWSRSSDTAFGLSQNAALAAAASYGDMFTQLGFTEKASAKMSKSTIKMAADLGSFNNLETSDVLDRISASLRGEFDSLQAVIPNINAARVQTEALAMTGKKSADALTAQEKAAATLAIIHKDGARASGDFARTQDGLANSNKVNAALIENLKTKIGSGLLPVWQTASNMLRTEVLPPLIDLADKWVPKIAAAIERWMSSGDPSQMLSRIGDSLRSVDWGAISASVSKLAGSGKELGPAFKSASTELPSLTDLIDVTGVALKFFADNADLLAKALPYLAGGFLALKVAQAGANAVAIASPAIRIAEVVATRAQTKAIVAQTAALRGASGAQVVNGIVTGTTTKMTIRQRIATVASTAATKASAAATKGMAVAQRVLNAAMRANPIGIVITVIAALAAGLVFAYKKSETFRRIVHAAFEAVKRAGRALGDSFSWVRSKVSELVGWVAGIPDRLRGLIGKFAGVGRDLIGSFVDGMKNAAGIVSGIAGNVWSAVKGLLNDAIGKINAAVEFTIDLPGPKNLSVNPPNIPYLATGGRVTRPTLAMVGDGREPETVMNDTMLTKALAMAARAGAGMGGDGRGGVTVKQYFPAAADPRAAADAAGGRVAATLEAWGL